jgi:hypothetical protein
LITSEYPSKERQLKLQAILEETLMIQSHSDNSVAMTLHVLGILDDLGIPYETDPFGNIIARKGSVERGYFPGIVCHLDTVHKIQDSFEIRAEQEATEDGDIIYSSPTGIGGDDKNGIAIVLWLLEHKDIPNIKAFFFQREEKGCEGSEFIDHKYFKDVGYLIQPDRRGSTDLITSYATKSSPICGEDFRDIMNQIGEAHGYSETSGSITDVVQLAQDRVGISVLNLSCGYYDPHRDKETVSLKNVLIAGHVVREGILTLGEKRYPFIMPPKKLNTTPVGYWKNGVHYPEAGVINDRRVLSPKKERVKEIGETGFSYVSDTFVEVPSLGDHIWVEYLDADEPDILQAKDSLGNDIFPLLDMSTVDEILEILFLQGELEHVESKYFFPQWREITDFSRDDYYNELEEL